MDSRHQIIIRYCRKIGIHFSNDIDNERETWLAGVVALAGRTRLLSAHGITGIIFCLLCRHLLLEGVEML